MTAEHAAFISYAHLDNQPVHDKAKGWIKLLHDTLGPMVSKLMGREVAIWRDVSLQGNTDFSAEIERKVRSTHIMVSVFTPRYVQSDWCKREVNTFVSAAESNGGLFVGPSHQARVFRVIKTPPLDGRLDRLPPDLPPQLGKATGYEFFRIDPADASFADLDPAYGEEATQEFLAKTRKLAGHIAALLSQLEQAQPTPAAAAVAQAQARSQEAATEPAAAAASAAGAKPVIYLSENSRFHRANREQIATELQREGYTVLPKQPLPTEEEGELVAAVRALLARAQMSVHMVGPLLGVVPEGPSSKSIGMWQNELAAERAQQAAAAGERFERVIWVAEGTKSDQPAQQAFIDSLHQQRQAQFGADLVTDDIEGFKRSIRDALQRLQRPKALPAAAPAGGPQASAAGGGQVYVVCDERDRAEAKTLLKALVDRGCDAVLPLFRGDAQQLRETHMERLATADAVLLYHGAGDAVWRSKQEIEIRKAAALRRERPWRAQATLLAGPASEDKQDDIDIGRPGFINAVQGLDGPAIDRLCKALGL